MPPPIPPAPPTLPPRPPTVPQSLELKRDVKSRKNPCLIINETSDELCQKDFRERLNNIIYKHEAMQSKKSVYLSLQRTVPALLQEGPQCGITALAMAHKIMGLSSIDVDSIMARAIENKYTLQGEMFSAFNMSKLADEIYHCNSELLDMECNSSKDQLIQNLIRGSPVLVPYDADLNHEPCKKKGHKAHWALLTGMLIVFDTKKNNMLDTKKQHFERNCDDRSLKNSSVTHKTWAVITETSFTATRSAEQNDITSPVEDTSLDSLINSMEISSVVTEPKDCTDSAQPLVDIQIALPNKTETSQSAEISEVAINFTLPQVGQSKHSEIHQTDLLDCNFGENHDSVSPELDYDVSLVSLSTNNVNHKQVLKSQKVTVSDTQISLEKFEESCCFDGFSLPDINSDAVSSTILVELTEHLSVTNPSQNVQVRIDDALLNVDQVSGESFDKVSQLADISIEKPLQNNGVITAMSSLDVSYGSTNQNNDSISPLIDMGIENSLQNCETTNDTYDLLDTRQNETRHSLGKVSPLADFGLSISDVERESDLHPRVTNSDLTLPLLDTAITFSSNDNQPSDKNVNLKFTESSVDGVSSVAIHCDETFPIEDVILPAVQNLQVKTISKNTPLTDIGEILQELVSQKFFSPHVTFLTQDSDVEQLFHLDPDLCERVKIGSVEYSKIYVYGYQGKSRRQAIWSLDSLLESNGNLIEIGPERTQESDLYIFPTEGIHKELRNKIVILKK